MDDESEEQKCQMMLKCLTCWNDFSEEEELNQHIIKSHDGMSFCSVHNRTEPLADSCPKVPETQEYYRLVSSRRNSADAPSPADSTLSSTPMSPSPVVSSRSSNATIVSSNGERTTLTLSTKAKILFQDSLNYSKYLGHQANV